MAGLQLPPTMVDNESMRDYVARLVGKYPEISSVWLLGSRANDEAREDSDWDLMAFGKGATLRGLKRDAEFHLENLDLFIVYTSTGRFSKPWGRKKSGTLVEWRWADISATEATYEAKKFIPSHYGKFVVTGQLEVSTKRAIRLWPLEAA